MLPEAKLALDSIKTALDIAKAIQNVKAGADFAIQLSDIRSAMLDAQAHASAAYQRETELTQSVRDLEAEIASLKAWEADKQRYELKESGAGFFTYAIKESERGVEPEHHLCTNCYTKGQKSIIQRSGKDRYYETHCCPRCNLVLGI